MNKPIRYDRHARKRMKWRLITDEEVELVLKAPDKIEETEKGRRNFFKMAGKRYLKVTFKELEHEILVISAVDKSD